MDTQKIDKYADYRYQITSDIELEEAKWLIKIGMFKNMEQYISQLTRSAIRKMKQAEKDKKRLTAKRSKGKVASSHNG